MSSRKQNPEWVKLKHWFWDLLAEGVLTPNELKVLGAFGRRFRRSAYQEVMTISQEQIAKELGLKQPNVSTALKGLRDKGVLVMVARGVYRISRALVTIGYEKEQSDPVKKQRGAAGAGPHPGGQAAGASGAGENVEALERSIVRVPEVKLRSGKRDRAVY